MHNKNSSNSSTQLSLELRKDMKKKKKEKKWKTSQERMDETSISIEEFNCNLLLCKGKSKQSIRDNPVSRIELVELVHEALVHWPVKKNTQTKNKTKAKQTTPIGLKRKTNKQSQ